MKRFTDTEKWADPWFRKLTLTHKLLWDYICARCDLAGVWKPDFELAAFFIGNDINPPSALEALAGRIQVLPNGNWLIIKFIQFQYGELSPDCRPHQAVLKLLKDHGIGYAKGMHRLPSSLTDMDKDKDKDKDRDRGDARGETKRFEPPTLDEVKLNGAKIGLPEAECVKFFGYYGSNGWRVGRNGMKCWRAAMIHWRGNWQERAGPINAVRQPPNKTYRTITDDALRTIEKFKPIL